MRLLECTPLTLVLALLATLVVCVHAPEPGHAIILAFSFDYRIHAQLCVEKIILMLLARTFDHVVHSRQVKITDLVNGLPS